MKNLNTLQLATIGLGLVAVVLAAVLPATAVVTVPVAAGLFGVAVPHNLFQGPSNG
jgi:hypothetical protein